MELPLYSEIKHSGVLNKNQRKLKAEILKLYLEIEQRKSILYKSIRSKDSQYSIERTERIIMDDYIKMDSKMADLNENDIILTYNDIKDIYKNLYKK